MASRWDGRQGRLVGRLAELLQPLPRMPNPTVLDMIGYLLIVVVFFAPVFWLLGYFVVRAGGRKRELEAPGPREHPELTHKPRDRAA